MINSQWMFKLPIHQWIASINLNYWLIFSKTRRNHLKRSHFLIAKHSRRPPFWRTTRICYVRQPLTDLTHVAFTFYYLVLQLSFLSKRDVVFYRLETKGCVKGIERSIGIVVEVGRVLRVAREEVGLVPALLDVNMIDRLPLLPPNQSHLKRRKVFLIITTRNWKGKRCAIIMV